MQYWTNRCVYTVSFFYSFFLLHGSNFPTTLYLWTSDLSVGLVHKVSIELGEAQQEQQQSDYLL